MWQNLRIFSNAIANFWLIIIWQKIGNYSDRESKDDTVEDQPSQLLTAWDSNPGHLYLYLCLDLIYIYVYPLLQLSSHYHQYIYRDLKIWMVLINLPCIFAPTAANQASFVVDFGHLVAWQLGQQSFWQLSWQLWISNKSFKSSYIRDDLFWYQPPA